jgi:hypothetical protein
MNENGMVSYAESSIIQKAKVDFRLKEYDGASDQCAVWFWELERALVKLRIHLNEYILYAINATTG